MHEVWYDYVKAKYCEKTNLCYMDRGSFIVHVKIDDIYKDVAEDVETSFDPSNYELNRLLPKGKNIKVIGLMKDELGSNIMERFVGLKVKTYSYLIDDDSKDKEAKGTKMCVIKRKLKFEDYENCFEVTQLKNKINHLEKDETDMVSLKKDYLPEDHKEFIKSNNLILKTQQRFKSERHNVFIEEVRLF